jgi:hypothetical protein
MRREWGSSAETSSEERVGRCRLCWRPDEGEDPYSEELEARTRSQVEIPQKSARS